MDVQTQVCSFVLSGTELWSFYVDSLKSHSKVLKLSGEYRGREQPTPHSGFYMSLWVLTPYHHRRGTPFPSPRRPPFMLQSWIEEALDWQPAATTTSPVPHPCFMGRPRPSEHRVCVCGIVRTGICFQTTVWAHFFNMRPFWSVLTFPSTFIIKF